MLGGELCPAGNMSPQTAVSRAPPKRCSSFPALNWALSGVYRSEWQRGKAAETYPLRPLRNHLCFRSTYLWGLSVDDEATSVSHVGCKESKRSVSVPRRFRVWVRVRVIQMSAFP